MKKKKLLTRLIAVMLIIVSVVATTTIGTCAATKSTTSVNKGTSYDFDTFSDLLKEGISMEVTDNIPQAFVPFVNLIGSELFGFDPDADIHEIKNIVEGIDSKLDDLKLEVSEGFEKVLAELDKNNKMRNAIDALAKAEFIAETIFNSEKVDMLDHMSSNVKELTPQQQNEVVEINADIVNIQQITELYNNLRLAKEYMSTGFIDTDYKSVFDVYYSYMKKQSMFCGEAANKAEPFCEVMKESYSKSSLILLYGLHHQRSLYLLSESKPTENISQEAIDAAAIAKTFGSLSVIDNKIRTLNNDASNLIEKHEKFVEKAKAESTTFINKDTVYVQLDPEIGNINISDCKTYNGYVSKHSFETEGITERAYNKTLNKCATCVFDNGCTILDMQSVPYKNFVTNTGKCQYETVHSEVQGTYFVKHTDDLKNVIDKAFSNVMINIKTEQINTANRLDHESVKAIIKHISENCSTDTIATYLESVGFNFGDIDIENESNLFLPTDDFMISNCVDRVNCKGNVYDINSLSKKGSGFQNCVDTKDPSGRLLFFKNASEAVSVNIISSSMNGRIDKGIYKIEGKLIVKYNSDNKPVYSHYEKVIEVCGTQNVYFLLPANIDMSTVKISLGYEGLGASKNHECICSYSFANSTTPCSEIELKMEGYTKIWLGYGVDASISCNGVVVATGEG